MKFTGNKIKLDGFLVVCNIKKLNRSKVLLLLKENKFIQIKSFRKDTFKEVNINLHTKMYWCESKQYTTNGNVEEKDLFNIIEGNYEICRK